MTENPVIEVKKVWKSFKTVQAVKGVDLTIGKGQFVALLGPNGAGKTTLVEMIEGIQKPDSGEITILGKTWKSNENELRRVIGLSLQETHFIDKLRVTETLSMFASFFGLGKSRVEEIIQTVGLDEKRKSYVVNLSGGQRQRLALGIALLNDPAVLLLDEPTTGLDPNARREIWDILSSLRTKSGTSMILTTHYMEEAEYLCDYIVIMDHGKVLMEGTREQMLEGEGAGKVIEFTIETGNLNEISLLPAGNLRIKPDSQGKGGTVALSNFDDDLPGFLELMKNNNIKLKHMECRRKTLDDLFVSLTGRKINE